MSKPIIGLIGYKGAGKTTITEEAQKIRIIGVRDKIERVGLVDPLYDMLIALGVPEFQVRNKMYWDEPIPVLGGRTIRHAAQTLGVEWGRNCISENLWTDICIERAKRLSNGSVVIIDGVRFANEVQAIKDAGGWLIAFYRHSSKRVPTSKDEHASESCIHLLQQGADLVFENTGNNAAQSALQFVNVLVSQGLLK